MAFQIIATLGPASQAEMTWQAMLAAGATGLRLNTSHLSLDDLDVWLARLQPFRQLCPQKPALVLDLQGNKWRLGQFEPFELVVGQTVTLEAETAWPTAGVLPVPHPDFFQAAPFSSGEILLNDAKIRLQVESVRLDSIQARVMLGGIIQPHKGITFSQSNYRLETLSKKDRDILERTQAVDGIRYAISYVRDDSEMARYREVSGPAAYLIAKLERPTAFSAALQMTAWADEMWVCRGDLGAELGLTSMAETVYHFRQSVAQSKIPILMAGQVLEHMTEHATPTRSEACYLYDCLRLGYQGVVLSDEAAIGKYPVEACRAAAILAAQATL